MRLIHYSLLAGGFIALATPASAATNNVIFNGNILATCVLTVGSNGTMTAGPDLQTLSSQNAGGSNGTVGLITTGGVSLSVDSTVSGVTKPSGDTTAIAWTPSFGITTGAHTVANRTTAFPITTPGLDTVQVHLLGTKTGSDVFTNGAYQATVTVRCE